MTVNLLWRSDVHLADQAPRSRTDDWSETVLGKLRQTVAIAASHKCDAILDGGDFFHVKSPSRTTHKLIQQVAKIHQGIEVYANVGNHDCKYGDIAYLDEQPLGVLFESGVFNRCYNQHEAEFVSGGIKVRVVGVPYHGTSYELGRLQVQRRDEDYLVVMVHCLASKEGGQMFGAEDVISYSHLSDISQVDVFCFGHWHKNQGVESLGGGRYVVNVGSLTRGALSEDEMKRVPVTALMSFGEEISIEQIPLTVAKPEDVFDVVGRVRQEVRASTTEAFVKSIQDTLVRKSREPLGDLIRKMNIPDEAKERALDFLERA